MLCCMHIALSTTPMMQLQHANITKIPQDVHNSFIGMVQDLNEAHYVCLGFHRKIWINYLL